MSKEWKTAAENYSIATDGTFGYAKDWEEVQQIFIDGANYASQAHQADYEELTKEYFKLKTVLQKLMPYLSLSTDSHCVTAVYRTPAQSLIEAAENMMAKDRAIYEAREFLGMNPKGFVVSGAI